MSVSGVGHSVPVKIPIWISGIYNHLITIVKVIAPISGRKGSREDPPGIIHINELPPWNMIVTLNIRQIIIIYIIVAHRPP